MFEIKAIVRPRPEAARKALGEPSERTLAITHDTP